LGHEAVFDRSFVFENALSLFLLTVKLENVSVRPVDGVWNVFPPLGTGLAIGIQRAGRRRRSPTATGSGRGRMDRSGSADRHCGGRRHSPGRVYMQRMLHEGPITL
jgi:hypothetical protein